MSISTATPASNQSRRGSCRELAESAVDYSNVVAILNDRWRVIACRHGVQWILQYRNRVKTVAGDVWRGRSYCHTREALIRVCDAHATPINRAAATALARLPANYAEGRKSPANVALACASPTANVGEDLPQAGIGLDHRSQLENDGDAGAGGSFLKPAWP